MGKGRENGRTQEYRPSQQGRKEIEKINITKIQYCETLGTTPLREYNKNRQSLESMHHQTAKARPVNSSRKMPDQCAEKFPETRQRKPHPPETDGSVTHFARRP